MDRNVIITGANRGIGNRLLQAFAENGDNVWACCRRLSNEFETQMRRLEEEHKVWIRPVIMNLDSADSISEALKTIFAGKLSIDLLVNNAGITDTALFMNTRIDKIKEIFAVNFFAPLEIMQKVLKRMMVQRHGCVINLASIAGMEHQPGRLAYGSSKAALIWATQGLAQEFGPMGIRINAIAPGAIETEMTAGYSDEKIRKIKSEVSLRRLGQADEIAKVALFLASEDASFINGQIIRVDGGRIC